MPESRKYQELNYLVIDFVDKPVLLSYASGINCSIITF